MTENVFWVSLWATLLIGAALVAGVIGWANIEQTKLFVAGQYQQCQLAGSQSTYWCK